MPQQPPVPLMSKDELIIWIASRLGAPRLEVELTEENYEDAIAEALRWFTAFKGVTMTMKVSITASVNEYPIPDEVDKITDVIFPSSKLDFAYLYTPYVFPDQLIPYNAFSAPQSGGIYSSWVQNMEYIDMAKRIMGSEPDWRQENRTLFIFPIPQACTYSNSGIVGEMWWNYRPTTTVIGQLNNRDHDLVKRYALAFCKRDLGMIRDRYGIYPGAQGAVPSDGKRLLQEAELEFQQLQIMIEQSGFPMGLITG